jgi:hypothetical protein
MPALIWISTREEGPASQQAKRVLAEHAAAALCRASLDAVIGVRSRIRRAINCAWIIAGIIRAVSR